MAEQLAVAQTVGTLSLSLRALADQPDRSAGASQPMIDRASYVTGGDVSRYQRRTIPGRQANAGPDHGTIPMPGGAMPVAGSAGAGAATGMGAPVREGGVQVTRGHGSGDSGPSTASSAAGRMN